MRLEHRVLTVSDSHDLCIHELVLNRRAGDGATGACGEPSVVDNGAKKPRVLRRIGVASPEGR